MLSASIVIAPANAQHVARAETVATPASESEIASLIRFRDASDAVRARQRLIRYVWSGARRPPRRQPDRVEQGIHDERFADLPNLAETHRLEIEMPFGVNSVGYHFVPAGGGQRLVLYHHGHGGGFDRGRETIAALLAEGFAVLALSMPLEGMNKRPVVTVSGLGPLHLTTHEHLKFLGSRRMNPLRFFLEPVVVAINYAERYGYRDVAMVGLSGGGWTTVVAAAVDPRIRTSVSVAGTLPIFLRGPADWGDFEQTDPGLLAITNYLEMYLLGSLGADRRQVLAYNENDSCCFAGRRHEVFEAVLVDILARLGPGELRTYLDSTHREHLISAHVRAMIPSWLR